MNSRPVVFDRDLGSAADRACYVGLLGSTTRSERLLRELGAAGINVTRAQRGRLHAPIGLDIGAETCEEIALAIVAEVRAALAARAMPEIVPKVGKPLGC
jgi:xanthine/CO dehydrogenase XdhC/CoxF family maturation factor